MNQFSSTRNSSRYQEIIEKKPKPLLFLVDPIPASRSGLYVPPEALIKETLDKFREAPLIGLEYIIEILRPRQEPIYKCMICKKSFDSVGVVPDVVSTNHRLGYLVYITIFSNSSIALNSRAWGSANFFPGGGGLSMQLPKNPKRLKIYYLWSAEAQAPGGRCMHANKYMEA
jgi:hypothetical protein